jgi:hypothetical protein
MNALVASPFLTRALRLDAAATAATAMLLFFGAGLLEPWLGIPRSFLMSAGLVLVPFVVFVLAQSMRRETTTGAIWAIIAVNLFWTADSFFVLLTGLIEPTGLGYAFVIAQALAVGGFALLQMMGLQRSSAPA